jgi:putative SOS response-associated peptidase YedK
LLNNDGKPNYNYATFNSRWDKLYSSRLTKGLFKTSRCIIPASGIIEGQNKKYHYIQGKNKGLALGGIYKTYQIGGEVIKTASIITCAGNPQLENIHKKSIPLMLDVNDTNLVDAWLSPDFTESHAFSYLLTNSITQDLIANPIVGARDLSITGNDINIFKS